MTFNIFNWFKNITGTNKDYLDEAEIAAINNNPALTEDIGRRTSFLLAKEMIARHASERRWAMVKRTLLAASMLLGLVYSATMMAKRQGFSGNTGPVASVISIHGNIMQTGLASADELAPTITAAFDNPKTKVVILDIDSAGGQPQVSDRIATLIKAKKKATGKPVVAVISNLGASAAYMIAISADSIYAGRYSLIGSIGAKLESWNFSKTIEKYDVQHRVYASGSLKNMLDQWSPYTEAADDKAQLLVNQMGQQFLKDVMASRAKKLKPGLKFDTGEVWVGTEAKAIGVIDDIATIDEVIESYHVKPLFLGPHDKGPLSFLSSSADWLAQAISNGIAQALASQSGQPTLR